MQIHIFMNVNYNVALGYYYYMLVVSYWRFMTSRLLSVIEYSRFSIGILSSIPVQSTCAAALRSFLNPKITVWCSLYIAGMSNLKLAAR